MSSALLHSLSAASAGTVATLTTHPFDVIKVCLAFSSSPRTVYLH